MKVVVNSVPNARNPVAAVSKAGDLIWFYEERRRLMVLTKWVAGCYARTSNKPSLDHVIKEGATPVYEGDSVTIQF